MYTKRRLQRGEAEQRRARTRSYELQQQGPLARRHRPYHLPEFAHYAIAVAVAPGVHCVRAQIRHIEVAIALAADKHLDLDWVEEADPFDTDNILKASQKGVTLLPDLPIQTVVCHQVDVLDAVAIVHFHLAASRDQFVH